MRPFPVKLRFLEKIKIFDFYSYFFEAHFQMQNFLRKIAPILIKIFTRIFRKNRKNNFRENFFLPVSKVGGSYWQSLLNRYHSRLKPRNTPLSDRSISDLGIDNIGSGDNNGIVYQKKLYPIFLIHLILYL